MTLHTNLLAANAAISFVKSKMTVGAYNRPEDVARVGANFNLREAIETQRQEMKGSHSDARAVTIAQSGMGCCGEMATLAYVFLRLVNEEHQHELPLAVLESCDSWNHAFLVIDAPTLREGDQVNVHRKTPPGWGSTAVICDPWLRVDAVDGYACAVRSGWPTFVEAFRKQTDPMAYAKRSFLTQNFKVVYSTAV